MRKDNNLDEELSKSEVRAMINNSIDDLLRERELKKKIRAICADVLDDFFKEMWHKKNFWKNSIKNG